MSKFSKFLVVGAVTLATSTAAFSQSTQNEITVIDSVFTSEVKILTHEEVQLQKAKIAKISNYFLQELNPIISKQYEKGTLSEKANIKVNITQGESKELYNNYFYRKLGQCFVEVNFNEKGQTPSIGVDQELNLLTYAKNDTQQKMLREFIVLHEHNHCEFSNFDNPIQFKTSNNSNYVLQGLRDLSGIELASNYSEVVNEGFADVSASITLLKEYGIKNDNVLDTIEAIKVQRKDTYIQTKLDSHFSHHALEELLKPENLNKVHKMTDPNEIKNFALELANKGAALTFYEKPFMRDATFHEKALFGSVAAEVGRLLYIKDKNLADLDPGYEHSPKNFGPNLVTELAGKLLKEPMVVKNIEDAPSLKASAEYVYEYMQLNTDKYKSEIDLYKNTMNDLNKHIYTTVKDNIKPTKLFHEDYSFENVIKNVNSLRNEYLSKSNAKKLPNGWRIL